MIEVRHEVAGFPATQPNTFFKTPKINSILLVDDTPLIQRLHRQYLEDLGYAVETAENGVEALHFCMGKQYQAVLMDIHMPIMDGIEATHQIRMQNRNVFPIIGLTTDTSDETQQKCLAAGMNIVLEKPISPQQLKKSLLNFIK